MKSCQDLEHLLDGFVDGETTPDERRQVERHLAGCSNCRGVVKETRALLAATETLARQIPPGRDLWPEIRAGVSGRRIASSTTVSAWSGARSRWIGLAASLLVVVLAGSTALWIRDSDRTPAVGDPRGDAVPAGYGSPASFDEEVRQYVEAAELLQASIRERGTRLSPETLAILEKNLAIIDQAITAVHDVLASDPGDRGNALMLQAMHQQKVELLRRVSRLSS